MEGTGAGKIAAIRPECPRNEETTPLLFTRARFLLRGGSGDVTGKNGCPRRPGEAREGGSVLDSMAPLQRHLHREV